MPLTGELSDLSLAELIEFFCNQRKTGRLKVIYSIGPGYFYLQSGSVVHARIGNLRGIEAVYYALTLPNASFAFSPAFEPPEHTINQPWTSVVLEGLRRMDEGVHPSNPFPDQDHSLAEEPTVEEKHSVTASDVAHAQQHDSEIPVRAKAKPAPPVPMAAMVAQSHGSSRWSSRPWTLGAVVGAIVLIVAVVGVPWGLYARNKAAKVANQSATALTETSAPANAVVTEQPSATATSEAAPAANPAEAAKRQREARAREKAKAAQESAAASQLTQPAKPADSPVAKSGSSPSAGAKRVTVTVTYDENGRVTGASGGDATALRIARQKRFPAGKAGSATVTIPIN
jgi:hypothetical protein